MKIDDLLAGMGIELRDFGHTAANSLFEFWTQAGENRFLESRAHFGDRRAVPKYVFVTAIAIDWIQADTVAGECGEIEFFSAFVADAIVFSGLAGGQLPVFDSLGTRERG